MDARSNSNYFFLFCCVKFFQGQCKMCWCEYNGFLWGDMLVFKCLLLLWLSLNSLIYRIEKNIFIGFLHTNFYLHINQCLFSHIKVRVRVQGQPLRCPWGSSGLSTSLKSQARQDTRIPMVLFSVFSSTQWKINRKKNESKHGRKD